MREGRKGLWTQCRVEIEEWEERQVIVLGAVSQRRIKRSVRLNEVGKGIGGIDLDVGRSSVREQGQACDQAAKRRWRECDLVRLHEKDEGERE